MIFEKGLFLVGFDEVEKMLFLSEVFFIFFLALLFAAANATFVPVAGE